MAAKINVQKLADKITLLKQTALELKKMGKPIPAVERNTDRILASIKMLEINISDIVE